MNKSKQKPPHTYVLKEFKMTKVVKHEL